MGSISTKSTLPLWPRKGLDGCGWLQQKLLTARINFCQQLTCFFLLKAQIPLTSSGEILCLESQFIASKLPVRPQGTVGHNTAVRGSSVICVVHWPQFIRFVDSDSHLSGLMGLSVQPFCARFPMDLVFRLYDECARSLRTDANGNKDCCLLICQ